MARKIRISKDMKKDLILALIFLIPKIIYIVLVVNILNSDKGNYTKADAILKSDRYEIVGKTEFGKHGDYYEIVNTYYNCEFKDKKGNQRYGYIVSSGYYTEGMDLSSVKEPFHFEIYYNDADFENGDEVYHYNTIPEDRNFSLILFYTILFIIPLLCEIGFINNIFVEYKKMKLRYS